MRYSLKKWIILFGSLAISACGSNENKPAPTESKQEKTPTANEVASPPFNDPKINFEHFGSYDLSTWRSTSPKIEDSEGDTVMESVTYTKDGSTMVVETSQSEYGHNVLYMLKGADGKVQKTRSLDYSSNPYVLTEEVNDYTLKPAKKFTRTQKMNQSWQQAKPLPTSATGIWQEGEADEYGDPDH
ncbi:MAG TPA: hypothetical protein PLO56_09520 [Rhodothermales bacterium]|nr:hypothetical protein [Rhodothermales bacterium]